MTREEARKAAEVMLAYANGKEVEFLDPLGNWRSDTIPAFNWFNFDYRIKKGPTYRPFKNKEECWAEMQKHQPFGWVKYKEDGYLTCLIDVKDDVNFIIVNEKFTFADGTPFGIKEE